MQLRKRTGIRQELTRAIISDNFGICWLNLPNGEIELLSHQRSTAPLAAVHWVSEDAAHWGPSGHQELQHDYRHLRIYHNQLLQIHNNKKLWKSIGSISSSPKLYYSTRNLLHISFVYNLFLYYFLHNIFQSEHPNELDIRIITAVLHHARGLMMTTITIIGQLRFSLLG